MLSLVALTISLSTIQLRTEQKANGIGKEQIGVHSHSSLLVILNKSRTQVKELEVGD